MNPAKSFIPDKYNNQMELKKLNRIKYFTKALLELRVWGFREGQVKSSANITAVVENLVVWHKVLPTYREVGVVYILIKTGKPYMVGKAV